jgi:hypothetical protein
MYLKLFVRWYACGRSNSALVICERNRSVVLHVTINSICGRILQDECQTAYQIQSSWYLDHVKLLAGEMWGNVD